MSIAVGNLKAVKFWSYSPLYVAMCQVNMQIQSSNWSIYITATTMEIQKL